MALDTLAELKQMFRLDLEQAALDEVEAIQTEICQEKVWAGR